VRSKIIGFMAIVWFASFLNFSFAEKESSAALDEFRQQIKKVLRSPSPAEYEIRLIELRRMSGSLDAAVSKQAVKELVTTLLHAKDERPTVIYTWFSFLGISPEEAIASAIPDLASPDVSIRRNTKYFIGVFEGEREGRELPIGYCLSILKGQRAGDRSDALIELIVDRSPESALAGMIAISIADAGTDKELVAEKMYRLIILKNEISAFSWRLQNKLADKDGGYIRAQSALREVSANSNWWARLYAIQILKSNRFPWDAGLVQKLCEDENTTVKNAAISLLNSKK